MLATYGELWSTHGLSVDNEAAGVDTLLPDVGERCCRRMGVEWIGRGGVVTRVRVPGSFQIHSQGRGDVVS